LLKREYPPPVARLFNIDITAKKAVIHISTKFLAHELKKNSSVVICNFGQSARTLARLRGAIVLQSDQSNDKKALKNLLKDAEYPMAEAKRILNKKGKKLTQDEYKLLSDAYIALANELDAGNALQGRMRLDELQKVLETELKRYYKSYVRDLAESLAIAFIIALCIRFFAVEAFKIPTGSMYPTLYVGDHIFVNKFVYGPELPFINKRIFELREPKRGEIIVFRFPNNPKEDYIKRVVGLPGDKVTIKGRQVKVNDNFLECGGEKEYSYQDNSGANHETTMLQCQFWKDAKNSDEKFNVIYEYTTDDGYGTTQEFTVPPNGYFVMGDNRDHSYDSRGWGFVPHENVKGKALIIWLALSEVHGFLPGRIGTILK